MIYKNMNDAQEKRWFDEIDRDQKRRGVFNFI